MNDIEGQTCFLFADVSDKVRGRTRVEINTSSGEEVVMTVSLPYQESIYH